MTAGCVAITVELRQQKYLNNIVDRYASRDKTISRCLEDFVGGKPIHVVYSYDEATDTGYVVTTYIPDPKLWQDNFRKRK